MQKFPHNPIPDKLEVSLFNFPYPLFDLVITAQLIGKAAAVKLEESG